jgi:hypothetical protein
MLEDLGKVERPRTPWSLKEQALRPNFFYVHEEDGFQIRLFTELKHGSYKTLCSLLTVFGFTVYTTICQFFRYTTCFDPKGSSSGVCEHLEFNFHCVSFTFFTCFKLLILKISVFKGIKHFAWSKCVEFVKLLLKLLWAWWCAEMLKQGFSIFENEAMWTSVLTSIKVWYTKEYV